MLNRQKKLCVNQPFKMFKCKKKKQKNIVCVYILTARISLANVRLSRSDPTSISLNSILSMPDLFLHCLPSMPLSARASWRPLHELHSCPTISSDTASPRRIVFLRHITQSIHYTVSSSAQNRQQCQGRISNSVSRTVLIAALSPFNCLCEGQ